MSGSSAVSNRIVASTYTVKPGDNLWKIAKNKYQDRSEKDIKFHIQLIQLSNCNVIGKDPAKIKPGMVLYLPPAIEDCPQRSRSDNSPPSKQEIECKDALTEISIRARRCGQ